jgi:hypothetical protein
MSHSHYRKSTGAQPSSYASIAASAVAAEASDSAAGTSATNPYARSDRRSKYESANLDGGYSFDQCKAVKIAVSAGDNATARRIAEEYLVKVATIGTNENVVNCSAQKLTTTAIDFVNYLIQHGMADLVVKVVTEVYNGNRAKKIDHAMFLLALCTTVPDSISGSTQNTAEIRRLGYAFVPEIRTGSHFLTWVSTHIEICKARQTKGTGNGFRNACKAWFLKNPAKKTQYQVVKYGNRAGFTMKDVLALTHIKATSKRRNASKRSGSSKIHDFLSADIQFVLACAVNGFEAALTELDEVAGRKLEICSTRPTQIPAVSKEMADALECVAYEAAVRIGKSETTTVDEVICAINIFGITHEMVNNRLMKDPSVLAALASRTIPSGEEILAIKVEITAPHLEGLDNIAPFFAAFQEGRRFSTDGDAGKTGEADAPVATADLTAMLEREIESAIVGDGDDNDGTGASAEVAVVPREPRITMPYNATIRFLNRLTVAGLFDRAQYPLAPQLLKMLTSFLVDPVAIGKSRIHPMAIFTALATYQSGGGARGSLTWSPNRHVTRALEDAIRVSFQNCRPHGKIVAHLIDASGSMTWDESCSIPGVVAREVAAFMVGVSMEIEDIANHPEKVYAGYFGSGGGWYGSRMRAEPFVDITDQLQQNTTLADVKRMFSKINGGCTNMQVGFDHYRKMLENSLRRALDGDRAFSHIRSALELPGFVELFQMWTDNDINSSKKVPECLNDYHRVQRAACEAFPRRLDGTEVDPALLFAQHSAKLTIVCTQASNYVVGDPFDTRVLCISGFDSSGPQLITNFLEDWDIRTGLTELVSDVGGAGQ